MEVLKKQIQIVYYNYLIYILPIYFTITAAVVIFMNQISEDKIVATSIIQMICVKDYA